MDWPPAAPIAKRRVIDPVLVDPATPASLGEAPSVVFPVSPYAFTFSAVLLFVAVGILVIRPDVWRRESPLSPVPCP